MTKKIVKVFLCFLFSLLTIGIAFSTINNQNLNKTIDIFNHTSSYSPLRIPKIFVQESEYRQLLSLFEDISLKTNIPYMKKVTNESHEINESFNFNQPPSLKLFSIIKIKKNHQTSSCHSQIPIFVSKIYSNQSGKRTSKENFFILTSDKEEYEGYIKGI